LLNIKQANMPAFLLVCGSVQKSTVIYPIGHLADKLTIPFVNLMLGW